MVLHHLPCRVNVLVLGKTASDGDSYHIHSTDHRVRHEDFTRLVYGLQQFHVEIIRHFLIIGKMAVPADLEWRNAEADGGQVSRHHHLKPLVPFYQPLHILSHYQAAAEELFQIGDAVAAENEPQLHGAEAPAQSYLPVFVVHHLINHKYEFQSRMFQLWS